MEATLLAAIAAAAAAINSGLVIWNFLQSPSRKNGEAIASMQATVAKLEKSFAEHDNTLKNMPTKDALHELQMSISAINTDVKVLATEMKAVRETSNLMRDYLLEKGVK